LPKIRKLAAIPPALRRGESFPVTRLTSLKSLCRDPAIANGFMVYLARKTLERVEAGTGRSGRQPVTQAARHHQLMAEAVAEMEDYLDDPTEERRARLRDLHIRITEEQNEYKSSRWGAIRSIHDWDLLLIEYAIEGVLRPPHEAEYWAYQTARHYAERYDSRHPDGLVRASAPLVQDIVDFWTQGLDLESEPEPPAKRRRSGSAPQSPAKTHQGAVKFTHRQGQFLAFIHQYRKLHKQGPAELDLVKFFRITPPSVHGMMVKLEELGLITREPGVPRSARVAIPEDQIPVLEVVMGPPW
jgi:hypothetical protein